MTALSIAKTTISRTVKREALLCFILLFCIYELIYFAFRYFRAVCSRERKLSVNVKCPITFIDIIVGGDSVYNLNILAVWAVFPLNDSLLQKGFAHGIFVGFNGQSNGFFDNLHL